MHSIAILPFLIPKYLAKSRVAPRSDYGLVMLRSRPLEHPPVMAAILLVITGILTGCFAHSTRADRFDDDPKRPSLFASLVAPQIPRVPGSLPRSERLVRWRCGVLSSSSSVIRLQKPQSKRLAIRRYVHRTSGSAGAEGIPLRSQFDWYLSMCCKRGLVTRNVLEISRRSN